MPKDYPRSYRVAEQIQRELAGLIRAEIKDPRLSPMITIAEVRVAPDLGAAKVYITVLDEKGPQSAEVLNRASGFLRSKLAALMSLRSVPSLKFFYDTTAQEGARLSALIDQAVADEQQDDSSE